MPRDRGRSRRGPGRRSRWRGRRRSPARCTRSAVSAGCRRGSRLRRRRRRTSPRSRRTRATERARRAPRPPARRCRARRTRSRAASDRLLDDDLRVEGRRPRRWPPRASSRAFTFVMPTDEPRFAGLTNSGKPSVGEPWRRPRAAGASVDGGRRRTARRGRPASRKSGLHRRLVHADAPRRARRRRRTARPPARAGPGSCRPRRTCRAAPGTRRRGPRPVTTARSGLPSGVGRRPPLDGHPACLARVRHHDGVALGAGGCAARSAPARSPSPWSAVGAVSARIQRPSFSMRMGTARSASDRGAG